MAKPMPKARVKAMSNGTPATSPRRTRVRAIWMKRLLTAMHPVLTRKASGRRMSTQ